MTMNTTDYTEIYLTSVFFSLGQMTALAIGTTFLVPMFQYYKAIQAHSVVHKFTPPQRHTTSHSQTEQTDSAI